jgi:SAM-dependent methyltransferase
MSKASDTLKLIVGRTAAAVFPQLGREIDEGRNNARSARLKRAIVYARMRSAQAHGDDAAVEDVLAAFWKGASGDRFFSKSAEDRFKMFRDNHAGVVDALAALLVAEGGTFSRLVEIGTGEGAVLAYCAEHLPGITQAIGLDINASVVADASARHPPGGKLAFVNTDARTWLAANPQPGTVLLSNGGVLEYFSEAAFDGLLQALAAAAPAAVALVEPVAPDHDLATRRGSFTFGAENSFSHNHRHRLERAGFEVVFEEATPIFGHRGVMMIGIRRSAQ